MSTTDRAAQRARRLYTALAWSLLPLALLRLLWRSRREPAYRHHMAERLACGAVSAPDDGRPLLWLHAVSLGETRAAAPLLEALRRERPELRLLLTHMTATGRQAGAEVLRAGDVQLWLPYDLPGAWRRFLRRWRPAAAVLMETEVWPNLAAACREAGVPLLLANARLSPRSAARWARWPALARAAYAGLGAAAQTDGDAARLRALGVADVRVAGNVKFDRAPDAQLRARGLAWREAAGARPVLLLASTRGHRGIDEETLLLDALPAEVMQKALVVIVPRHPQRVDAVFEAVRARGLRVARRSAAAPDAHVQVWLGDSLGEMPAYYAMADAAFVGGSLLPLGGQNLIEACAEGCPVVMGPHVFNFAQAVEQGRAAGAVLDAADGPQVWARRVHWLQRPEELAAARAAATAFSAAHRGAARAQAAWIAAHLR